MDDSSLYTGVDSNGIFDNEIKDIDLQEKILKQEETITQLKPVAEKLQMIINKEIELSSSIDRFLTATIQPEDNIRAELQATALYNKKLKELSGLLTRAIDKK